MKTDTEVQLMLRERKNGKTLEQAAARANMSVPTARTYLRAAKLPRARKAPRTYRTHPNPFEVDWPWVAQQLERDPALQAKPLFGLLCEEYPDRYTSGQRRTFQWRVARWRALHGPDKEVIFEQIHQPGRLGQSDFTHMDDRAIPIAAQPFPHLLYHLALTYSNVEAGTICFAESFAALAEGLETCLGQLGGGPQQPRTDHLSAAVQTLGAAGQRTWTDRYTALLQHSGMPPSAHNPGEAHEKGDVDHAPFRCKDALAQARRMRGSRAFADRAASAN